jgi:hypothetical protein
MRILDPSKSSMSKFLLATSGLVQIASVSKIIPRIVLLLQFLWGCYFFSCSSNNKILKFRPSPSRAGKIGPYISTSLTISTHHDD